MANRLELIPLEGFPLVEPGDDLAAQIADCLSQNGLSLCAGDVLVIAQKVVSKAEDRYVSLADVVPGEQALRLAETADKDPRQVQLVLDESVEVVRVRPGVIVVEQRDPENPRVLLLPQDADVSANALRSALAERCGTAPQVIINDSLGRAWRNGTVGVAIGCAGIDPLHTQIGDSDLFGNVLEVTEPAVADELAAAASLVMGQAREACPVVLARGAFLPAAAGGSQRLIRDKALDMFR